MQVFLRIDGTPVVNEDGTLRMMSPREAMNRAEMWEMMNPGSIVEVMEDEDTVFWRNPEHK